MYSALNKRNVVCTPTLDMGVARFLDVVGTPFRKLQNFKQV